MNYKANSDNCTYLYTKNKAARNSMKMDLILRKLNIEGAFNVFPERLDFIQLSINRLVL